MGDEGNGLNMWYFIFVLDFHRFYRFWRRHLGRIMRVSHGLRRFDFRLNGMEWSVCVVSWEW